MGRFGCRFIKTLVESGLVDMSENSADHTFFRGTVSSKIDRFLVSPDLAETACDLCVLNREIESDHRPVTLDLVFPIFLCRNLNFSF